MNSGRTTDEEFWKALYGGSRCNWGGDDWDMYSTGRVYYDGDLYSGTTKRKHEFTPVLLIFNTVYNCKHCDMKKEDCISEYCDTEYPDIGSWG